MSIKDLKENLYKLSDELVRCSYRKFHVIIEK